MGLKSTRAQATRPFSWGPHPTRGDAFLNDLCKGGFFGDLHDSVLQASCTLGTRYSPRAANN